ncbi:MAG: protein kinase [Nannocystaceae bacterium]
MTSSDDETLAAPPDPSIVSESTSLRTGTLFAGRYEVQQLLGTGGMGSVHRVRDAKLDEIVALKLLTLHGEQAEERFVSEVRLARRVTHPNVARTHDFGEEGQLRFLTMEYVPGTTLERIFHEQAPLTTRAVVDLGVQIAAGLAAAHEAGVIHRDLKPANVLLREDQRVVITDFGIARAVGAGAGTRTGSMMGTPLYMAPEQVMGQPADARSDIYALGVILYELATGSRPFAAETAMASALARVQACPIDPRTHHPVDEALSSLVLRCLAREPEGRPSSALEVEQALRVVVGEAGPVPEPTLVPFVEAPSRPYAPMSADGRTVAVLPFTYRGGDEHAYLGEAMAEELIDVLSQTRGLRVLSSGATRRFADSRDPARIGAELSAESIVDGTVQHTGDRMRLSVRMIDPDGTQRWAERYDGSLQDVFALQESLGRRVAEALRIELDAAAHRGTAPPEALGQYLRARRLQRRLTMEAAEEALAMLERAIDLAPDFAPALAAHAMASVRAWWGYEGRRRDSDHAERARESVRRAQRRAPALAETHLATAMWEVQGGGFIAAARALGHALELAPTMAEAHQYLGQLQCEAGRPKEGQQRLELALELDPSLYLCHYTLSRAAMLDGDPQRAQEHIDVLWRTLPGPPLATLILRFRMALYRGDHEDAAQMQALMRAEGSESGLGMDRLAGVGLGTTPVEEAEAMYEQLHGPMTNSRFTTLMRQIGAELYVTAGAHDLAQREITAAADSALIDVVWMQRCPLLEPLRSDPAFARAERTVQRRAASIWR